MSYSERDYPGYTPPVGSLTKARLPESSVMADHGRLEYAFPEVDPPYLPLGKMIVVQLRSPGDFKTLANGKQLFFADETKDADKFNIQTGRVRLLGPVAYKNRLTLESFPEGPWCKPGDFVRVPKYGGDRVAVPTKDGTGREAIFLIINDTDVLGLVNGDPLAIKAIL